MLEISYNRIRELTKQSFARYPNIRLLYMYENMIRTVEEGAFAHLTNLEVKQRRMTVDHIASVISFIFVDETI